MTDTVTVTGTYSEGCFCARPALQALSVPYRPRFEFARGARKFAALNGLTWGGLSTNRDRSAYACLEHTCAHRVRQAVRIEWLLEYGEHD